MGDRTKLLTKVQEDLCETARFEHSAFIGWLYTAIVDRSFVDSSFEPIRPQQLSSGSSAANHRAAIPRGAANSTSIVLEHYAHILQLVQTDLLTEDSFCQVDCSPTAAAQSVFAKDKFNVLIIGAGCTGLALANTLQVAFGDRVRVLVVEKRISKPHYKLPYQRDWLTYIRVESLTGLIDDQICKTLAQLGDHGFMGVPLRVFETLLLDSCKKSGVNFLYSVVDDFAPIISAGADVVIDATGGRLRMTDSGESSLGPTFTERSLDRYGEAYARCGITTSFTARKLEVQTVREGHTIYPLLDGKRMKLACLKLTNVPIRLYQMLLDYVRGRNHDGRFYIWPGMLRPEINSLLLIFNLRRSEFEALANRLLESTPLERFLSCEPALGQLDRDLGELLKLVAKRTKADEGVMIEPPFIFAPYLRPYRPNEQMHGKPLIRVGDSIFNGNPKTGNGLSRHLAHLAVVRDCLAKCVN